MITCQLLEQMPACRPSLFLLIINTVASEPSLQRRYWNERLRNRWGNVPD